VSGRFGMTDKLQGWTMSRRLFGCSAKSGCFACRFETSSAMTGKLLYRGCSTGHWQVSCTTADERMRLPNLPWTGPAQS